MAATPKSKRTDTNWLRTELLAEFKKISTTLSNEMDDAERKREQLQESFEKVKSQIVATKQELIAELERLQDETINMADKLKQGLEEKIDHHIADLEIKRKRIQASVDRITQNKSTLSAQKEMEYLHTAQSEIAKIHSLESRTLAFKTSNMLISLLRQIDNFGPVDAVHGTTGNCVKGDATPLDAIPKPQTLIDDYVKTLFPDVVAISKDETPTDKGLQASPQPSLRDSNVASFPLTNSALSHRAFTLERRFRLQLSDKHKVTEACCLNGIAILDNKYIAVCDSPHDCIQVFNGNYDLLAEIYCTKPRGICAISNDAFAVSFYGEPIIKLLSIERSKFELKDDMKISCRSWVRDIKHMGKCLFLLCDDGDIHRTNLKGKGEGVFPTGLGKHQCRHLCVNKDARRFFVSGEEAVVCLDKEGNQLWKYCDTLAKTEGRGLAVFDNHIVMSDWKNSSLIELTEDGKVVNIIKGIGYPYALSIVEVERFGRAFVTQFSRFVSRETRRCVHVYRIGKANIKH